MSSEELMLDDLVYNVKDGEKNPKIWRIQESEEIDKLAYNYFRPIPLTDEIMDKIFGPRGEYEDWIVKQLLPHSDEGISVYKNDEGLYCFGYYTKQPGATRMIHYPYTVIKDIRFVHRLQHILRLCNIDKEVNI